MFLMFVLCCQFGGDSGEQFVTACSDFCRDQSHAHDVLKVRRQKDPKLDSFLQVKSYSIVDNWSIHIVCLFFANDQFVADVNEELDIFDAVLLEMLGKFCYLGDVLSVIECLSPICSYILSHSHA